MLRCAVLAARSTRPLLKPYTNACTNAVKIIAPNVRCLSIFQKTCNVHNMPIGTGSLRSNKQILDISKNMPPITIRTVTKFSLRKGKRKTVKAAVKRFFRLHWGGWIRTKVGRTKKLWKKSSAQKRRLRQHVFCNATQNTLLDKMVTKFWQKPKYYVNDPYAPYHTREEYHLTRKKPSTH